MKRKILYIAYFYPPVSGVGLPAFQRVKRFLKYLEGYESYVLTMKPANYPDYYEKNDDIILPINNENIVRTDTLEFFKVLTNMKSLVKELIASSVLKKKPSVSIKNKDINNANRKSFFSQLKDSISTVLTFPDFAHPWLFPAVIQGIKTVKINNIDIIFATGMPWTSLLVGYFIKLFTGKKLVIDFRDPWVNNPYVKKNRMGMLLDEKCESMLVHKADLILANTEPLKKEMHSRYPDRIKNIVTLPNGYDVDDFQNISKINQNKNKLVISHAGLLYLKRDPVTLIKAIEKINKSCQEYANEIQINQIGNIDLGYDLPEYCRNKKIHNYFNFIKQLDHKLCLGYLTGSDILLVIQPGTKTQIPSKLYEYIYLGKPIVAITEKEGALGQLIFHYGFGIVFDPDDHVGIAEYIVNMVKDKRKLYFLKETKYKNRGLFDAHHIASCLGEKLQEV
jgi:glycosyltransferase involved in cell wall biosynthesis